MNPGSSASSQEPIRIGQMSVRYFIDGTATGGMGVFELGVPPNANVPPPHSHTANEECVYVLEGVLRYSVDGVTRDLRPGDWMFTPRGSVRGRSAAPARGRRCGGTSSRSGSRSAACGARPARGRAYLSLSGAPGFAEGAASAARALA